MNLRESWDGEAENWIRFARTPGHDFYFWEWGLGVMLEMLPPPGRLTVDVGCGEGRVDRILRDRGHRVVGFDGSPALVGAAVTHQEAAPTAVADGARLPLASGSADLAVFYMSLHDIDDSTAALAEAARVLAPGGRLFGSIVHPINSAMDLDAFAGDGVAHIQSYFQTRRTIFTTERGGFPMTFHSRHRPLSAYTRALEDAGFLIESLREPEPPAEFLANREKDERWARIPWAMFLRAVRT